MAAIYQAAVADGKHDLWGTHLRFLEPESEHSSASAAEGFALAGGRVTNFTAGQGLILMKEVLYVITGKRLPIVFHVGARALTSQALNIHAGHDDVYGVADTGWGILFARNVQQAADLTAIARRVAEETQTPFLVCQDGFLTTHTLENTRLPEDELLRQFVGDPRQHIRDLFDPAEALMSGVVQNQDSYMKGRIGQRAFTDTIPGDLRRVMDEWTALTGRRYAPIETYRCEDAEHIVVAMGTIADSLVDVVDHFRAQGRRGRLRDRHQLPALPGRGARGGPGFRPRGGGAGADRRAAGRLEPADPRDPGGSPRPCHRWAARAAGRLGCRRAGLA